MHKKKNNFVFLCASVSLWLIVVAGCATSTIFQSLGDNISSPNGMVIDVATNRLYLVNSNSNVLYDWAQGSMQIYDITDPLNLELLYTIPTDSFGGEAVLDGVRKLLYVSDRFSQQANITEDHLLLINIDEGSPDFENVGSAIVGKDPYGLYCCYPADRMWISTGNDDLEYIDLATQTVGSLSLLTSNLSNGGSITQAATSYIAVNGNQAFLPRNNGGLFVINLDDAGDPTKNAIDYFIEDLTLPGGVATDGTYLYVVDQEQEDDYEPLLLVFNLSALPPISDNTTTQVLDKDNAGLMAAQIIVEDQPATVFLTSQYAFVTCGNYDDPGFVSVIDLATLTLSTNIAMGQEPFGMALYAPGGVEKYLYVGDVIDNTLTMIDIPSLTIAGVYP